MKKTLYLECYSGISGDMTVGALLDLGADQEVLKEALDSLQVEGYEIKIGRTKKCGIDACDFDVILTGGPDAPHDHDHDHHHHDHDHDHHHHDHEHEHHHDHAHVHRNINDVFEVIDRLKASEKVKELSRQMFRVVAEAESKAHGLPIEEVHFHEVGAIDSIVDIISTAVCLDNLGIDEVIVSPLYEGTGHVHCAHGLMPVPVPAVANIAANENLTLKITDNEGEMVTPTGAAIAATLRTGEKLPENYRIVKIGLGAGKKDFAKANVLRAMIIEETEDKEKVSVETDRIWELETNVDDCTGEALGYTSEKLMEAGARDACFMPAFMKKGRPGYLLKVICTEDKIEELEDIIFAHTTTVGIRRVEMVRTVMERRIRLVETAYGPMRVKDCTRKGVTRSYPEYEDVKAAANRTGKDFQEIFNEVAEAAKR